MSWGNLFLAACFYLALPILYAVLRNSSKERNNLILSVTLTPEGRNAPEVEGICRAYRKKLTWIFLALTVIPHISLTDKGLFASDKFCFV